MTNPESAIVFDRQMASSYDKGNAVFAPTRDALNFLIHAIFANLPNDAQILCVGVGTGSEVIDLADVAYDRSASTYPELLDIWLQIMTSAGMPVEMVRARISAAYGRDVAVLPPSEVASIIAAGGFDPPVLFFQTLLMHAWYAKRGSID